MEHPAVGFFEAEMFHPARWRPNYPQPAFLEMTNQDAYWGAKIVMAFTPEEIRAIVKQGRYSDPAVEEYIADTLIKRREKIGRYWYNKVNPLDRFVLKEDGGSVKLHFTDLGVQGELWQPATYHYELRHYKSNEVLDSGSVSPSSSSATREVLTGSTDLLRTQSSMISISPQVLSSMDGFINGKGAAQAFGKSLSKRGMGDFPHDAHLHIAAIQNRFFYYRLNTEREGRLSKAVRVYIYRGEDGSNRLKIVRIEREG
jgi:hypothetical protein